MTESKKLEMLRRLTGEADKDVLSIYLSLSKDAILSRLYPYGDSEEVPEKYHTLQVQIAEYLMNKRGAEGEKSHTENGVSRTYENADIPQSFLRRITPVAGVL